MGDYEVSESESSYADARADTPTLGERSDSEDTLSNLSIDNILPVDNHEVDLQSSTNGHGQQSSGLITPSGTPVPTPRSRHNLSTGLPGSSSGQVQFQDEESLFPQASGGNSGGGPGGVSASSSTSFVSALAPNGSVKVCITDADLNMTDSVSLDLPPGAQYLPTSDFPRSPSQLKIQKGPTFMPQEDPSGVSEDESSVSSYNRAHLDLNFQNGDVRLTKKDYSSTPLSPKSKSRQQKQHQSNLYSHPTRANFIIPSINYYEEEDPNQNNLSRISSTDSSAFPSLLTDPTAGDALEDYIEDFILPMSHESVMSRQLSFRKKVQLTLENIAAERASQELDKFDTMLSTYDEEDESISRSTLSSPSPQPQSVTPTPFHPVPKSRHSRDSKDSKGRPSLPLEFSLDPTPSMFEPSLLDIDAIVNENAPNLFNPSFSRKGSNDSTGPLTLNGNGSNSDLESMSNYFLPQQTLDKLYAVYESNNFNNLYCLSGEIKNILSPSEIEEIVANKDHLEKFIDPNVMAALSWSLNPASLPTMTSGYESIVPSSKTPLIESPTGLKSKSSSISNGFHSDASSSSSCEDDNQSTTSNGSGGRDGSARLTHPSSNPSIVSNSTTTTNNESAINTNKKTVPVQDNEDSYNNQNLTSQSPSPSAFQRDSPMTNSMRRKIALSKGLRSPTLKGSHNSQSNNSTNTRTSEESLDDLGVGDEDWMDEDDPRDSPEGEEEDPTRSSSSSSGVFLVRRDSKRFSFKGKDGTVIDRIVEGLFVESKNTNPKGTLRRIKLPLNLTDGQADDEEEIDLSSPEPPESSLGDLNNPGVEGEAKSQKSHRKKITVDENILSVMSTDPEDLSQATDCTRSDVFHSIINPTLTDEDATMRTDNTGSLSTDEDEITLDIDTPDDMEDSIMGPELESIATSPQEIVQPQAEIESGLEDSMRWKSYKVGPADVQIDLEAIHPYRKCLSHGGYFDAEKNIAIILFSGCYLPDRSRKEYTYLMDHLFLYVLSTLEELIVEDYMLVYLHGATPKSCMPTYGWLKKCYQLINHRLRKNLKGLYLVHPTFWLRTVVALTKPFVSTKFSRKVRFMNTLSDLCLEIPTEHLVIPDRVLQYDFDIKVDDLKRRKLMS